MQHEGSYEIVKNSLSVMLFALIGGFFRYAISLFIHHDDTLYVNVIGCFFLAFISYYAIESQSLGGWLTVGLGTGLIGSFTSFSAFSLDMVKYAQSDMVHTVIYLLLSVFGGFIGIVLGAYCGKKAGRWRKARKL